MIFDIKNCLLTDLDFLMDRLKKRVRDMFSRIPNLQFFFQDFLNFFFTMYLSMTVYFHKKDTLQLV